MVQYDVDGVLKKYIRHMEIIIKNLFKILMENQMLLLSRIQL